MSNKALITRRDVPRTLAVAAVESSEAESIGLKVERQLPFGTLVVGGDEKQFQRLEAKGYRVKIFPDINILEVGQYRIDTEKEPPKIPASLQVSGAGEKNWRDFLVQLNGPRIEEWTRAIEERGIDVIEPISAYGLYVVGDSEDVSKLKGLPFVTWVGPFQPAYRINGNLAGQKGMIKYVSIGVHSHAGIGAVKDALKKASAKLVRESEANERLHASYVTLIVEMDAKAIPDIAGLPGVRWLEYASPTPGLDGERETQIVAENLDGAAAPNTAPVPGYQAWLAAVGLTGNVPVAICDTGVDANADNNVSGHADIRGRQIAFVDYSGGAGTADTDGHGTHVAGIAVGNAATGQTEAAAPNNYLWGQGMSPAANYVNLNATDSHSTWPPADWGTLTRDSVNNGARVMNNSWNDSNGAASTGYNASCRRFDQLVRDPNDATAALEDLAIVFSAGNAGPNAGTITSPHVAKNPIIVGNSLTRRPGVGDVDDIRGIRSTSSRGPAADSRIFPNVVAPGTDVSSTFSRSSWRSPIAGTGTPDPADPTKSINQYLYLGGTSMSAPHVTGCCSLLVEWWRQRARGVNPSPAILKALLVNGAEDLFGGPDGKGGTLTHIPNNDQGWGRVSMENILLQSPASDRGPKIFSDQRHAFTATGQHYLIHVAPADTGRPLRITLAWTDAPGAVNANPALVNDLDLEVTEVATGHVFKGNVFTNGFSTTGGAFDNRNNVECVYIQNPSGIYEVRVVAANISANALPPFDAAPWQDFALVIDNADVPGSFPVSVVPVIDRSGSMVFYGYESVTRTSSKQFIDLMSVDDKLGVVSFGSTSSVDYPAGPAPALQNITGQPIKDAAKAGVDGITFGGCTYMGDGINKASDLLNAATGERAMVLLSDGYDNKGCDQANPAKPSAMDAVATLPANMPVYTCAMGMTADQALLEHIASATGGRYYYMPTIDDLFEIYNYIRGQVTGDSIIVNESATASSSRIGAFVDEKATEATFSIAWGDSHLQFVARAPREPNELTVRLRNPQGKLVHPSSSLVRRIVGAGYVIFKLQDPMPGQWYAEVETAANTHTRYTVGGFVKSPLRLKVTLAPRQVIAGLPLTVSAAVLDGRQVVSGFKANAQVVSPGVGIPNLLKKYGPQLEKITVDRQAIADRLPGDMAKLVTYRGMVLKEKNEDLFVHDRTSVVLRRRAVKTPAPAVMSLASAAMTPASIRDDQEALNIRLDEAGTLVTKVMPDAAVLPGVVSGKHVATKEQGSYNVVVTADGILPGTNTRFVRKELVSVLVK